MKKEIIVCGWDGLPLPIPDDYWERYIFPYCEKSYPIKRTDYWRLQRKWRKRIFQRDNYKCRYCGNNSNLHLHHIISRAKFERLHTGHYHQIAHATQTIPIEHIEGICLKTAIEMSYCDGNLVTLCKKCHNIAHRPRYRKIQNFLNELSSQLCLKEQCQRAKKVV